MHYWDPFSSGILTDITKTEGSTFTFTTAQPDRVKDPRQSSFCIKDKKYRRTTNVTLDIGCDEDDHNDVDLVNQQKNAVNTVANLSYLIGLIEKYGLEKVFPDPNDETKLTYAESEFAFYPTSGLDNAIDFYIDTLLEREKRFTDLYNSSKPLGKLYSNLKTIYNNTKTKNIYSKTNGQGKNKDKLKNLYIILLLDMKRTEDWGQVTWM